MVVNLKNKTCILVGICSAQRHAARRAAVRETWLRFPQEGVSCLFFLGEEVPDEERGDTVSTSSDDTYNALPGKVLGFFRYALEHYDFEWLFKCDDDTYLDLSRLPELANPQYGIIGDTLLESRRSPGGGAGYFLSRDIVEKIVACSGIPLTGAEDVIFGELALCLGAIPCSTSRLSMSHSRYPSPVNNQVSAHWCSPETMRMLHVLRWSVPVSSYRAVHKHWTDDLLFYKEGVFCRKSTSCWGRWVIQEEDVLMLDWTSWSQEQLVWRQDFFIGSGIRIEKESGSLSLWEVENRQPGQFREIPSLPRLHLGCGSRKLPGWVNLDLPNFDITLPLPWASASVEFYYLEHVIEYITQPQLHDFLLEVKRTLKPGGVIRFSFTDIDLWGRSLTPASLQLMRTRMEESLPVGTVTRYLIEHLGQKSFWTADSLASFLVLTGFSVTNHAPGFSSKEELSHLEKDAEGEQPSFELLGTVCLEAVLLSQYEVR